MVYGSLKGLFLVLEPTVSTNVPNGSVFINAANGNTLSSRDNNGNVFPLVPTTAENMFLKQMQVVGPIAINVPVSKRPDGKIEAGDSDSEFGQRICGYSLQAATMADELITVLCIGANIPNALAGLGYGPGQDVFLSEDGGYTNTDNFTGSNDSIIKVGMADCAAGAANTTATDLIAITEVLLRP